MSTTALSSWLAHRPRRGATQIDTVVLHATGTDDVEQYLHDLRTSNLSYHYLVLKSGEVQKCVPYSAVAFHAGNSWGPHEEKRGIAHEQDSHGHFVELTSVNEYSIGVCLENLNDGTDWYPKEQVDSCVQLLCDLKEMVPKLQYLTTHALVAPGQQTDPAGFETAKIAKKAGLEYWQPAYL
ncbi:MAG: N-acetylmuramoyl-L-alanine amidase [Fimbriimonas sp.]